MAERTGDKVLSILAAQSWRGVVILGLGFGCLLILVLWILVRSPAEPDWRQAIAEADAADDCKRVFAVASSAASLRVSGAPELWMQRFGAAVLAGHPPDCANSWAALLEKERDAQGTQPAVEPEVDAEELQAFTANVAQFAVSFENAGPPYRPPGRLAVSLAALRGFEVLPGYVSGHRLEPTFAALTAVQRVMLAWHKLRCDAVWNIDKPNWRIVENDIRGDAQGPWQAFDTQCGQAALGLVDDIGVDARGAEGVAVDMLLDYSGRLARSRYVSAYRLLVDGIVRPYAADDDEIIASLHGSAYSDLAFAILEGHGPSMVLYARQLLNGKEQQHKVRRMGVLFYVASLSDTQYAFGLLTLAQAAGEDVSDDLARAAVGLGEEERAVAMAWAEEVMQ